MSRTEVVGARGNIDDPQDLILALQELDGGSALPLNADLVCGKEHLLSAAAHALRAFERGGNVCSSLAMETLVYASGERQISKAMQKMGVTSGPGRIAIVFFGPVDPDPILSRLGLDREDSVLDLSIEKMLRFGISREEIDLVPREAVGDLVLERVAFVELMKR